MNCWSIYYSFHGMLNNACYFKFLVLMLSNLFLNTNHSSNLYHPIQPYDSPCCWVSQCAALKTCKRSNRLVLISSISMFVHNFGTILVHYKHFDLTICGYNEPHMVVIGNCNYCTNVYITQKLQVGHESCNSPLHIQKCVS